MLDTSLVCRHCGAPLSASQADFCCSGCEQISQILEKIPESERNPAQSIISAADPRYCYLDQKDFSELYKSNSNSPKYRFFIEGIHCASCIRLLECLPQIDSSVKSAELHYGENVLDVSLNPGGKLSQVASLIHRMGYIPHPISKDQDLTEQFAHENRKDLIRIAVAAAVVMNIMLLSISVYAGLTGVMADWFNLLQGLLFLPILFYAAIPFYMGTLRALRFGQISIDLPITIALVASSCFSFISLATGGHQIYFDSTSSFILLILSSRYLLKRIQQQTKAESFFSEFLQNPGVWVLAKTGRIFKPIKNIEIGETIIIQSGDRIPVDGILLSDRAALDFSVVTGESAPRTITKGMDVLAGSRSFTNNLRIKAVKTGESTQLGEMLKLVESNQRRKTPLLNKADKVAQVLILIVNLVAAVFYFYYSRIDQTQAFSRALALIVLACPCALALGAPLAISQGLKRALRLGIVIKSPDVLEKAIETESVAFDKTGTLTIGSLRLYESPLLSSHLKSILLGLESQSRHPIAFALRKIWDSLPHAHVVDLKEIPGVGVQGKIGHQFYEFRTEISDLHSLGPTASLFQDGRKILSLKFADQNREEASSVIQDLQGLGYKTLILSGDRSPAVTAAARQLGISIENTFSELSPQGKQKWLQDHPRTVMVGDGANDILSMADSHFSVAVRGAVHEALKSADVYISADDLEKLTKLFLIAKETQKVVRRNIGFALTYNILAGSAALLGMVGPLGAALLMPVSSIIIIAHSFYGTSKLRKLENTDSAPKNGKNISWNAVHMPGASA